MEMVARRSERSENAPYNTEKHPMMRINSLEECKLLVSLTYDLSFFKKLHCLAHGHCGCWRREKHDYFISTTWWLLWSFIDAGHYGTNPVVFACKTKKPFETICQAPVSFRFALKLHKYFIGNSSQGYIPVILSTYRPKLSWATAKKIQSSQKVHEQWRDVTTLYLVNP